MALESFYFLRNGGELGALMRSHDWKKTPVGSPDEWPHSLRNTVGFILNSKFPMFLFWGKELTCFYNDAYRPSLGMNGKHPSALGKSGEAVFPEIWKDIKPLIDDVFAGKEAIMHRDLLLPIYRNGQLEDVYWTFCYSPAFLDDGTVGGVMVVCQETNPNLMRQLEESESMLRSLVEQAPVAIGVVKGKELVITTVNQPILDAWGKERTVVGMPLIKALPELEGQPFIKLLKNVYETGVAHYASSMPAKLLKNGQLEDVYSDFIYTPLRDGNGLVDGVMILATIVTEQVLSRKALEESEARYRSLINAAPVAITLFTGRDLVIEEPNQAFLDMLGGRSDVAGKPLRDAMPELVTENQPFLQILDDVYTSGKAFTTVGTEVAVRLNGKLTRGFYDFSYTPLFNEQGNVYAILEIAVDVTPQVAGQRAIRESEDNLRNIILQAPAAMAILKGENYTVEIANDKMYELWGRSAEHFIGRPIFEALPEAADQGLQALIAEVMRTGVPYYGNEAPINLPRNGGVEILFVNFVYQAYRERDGSISGVMVLGTDVTDQVNARTAIENSQLALQHTTNRLQMAIEAGELGMYELDMTTDILTTSPRFNEIFEVTEKTTRTHYVNIIHPDDRDMRDEAHRRALETGTLNYTVRLLCRNNHIKWIKARGLITFDEKRVPMRMMGVVQDITDAKELEFQKDSFLGIASHELKTPVTSIKSYVQLMETMLKKDGATKYADMMTRIDKQVNRLNFLITDLLDVTKINSGRLQLNITRFNFDTLVNEVAEDIQRVTPRHKIVSELKCDSFITADRERIIQVITNLINNAIKYSPDADHINIYTKCENDEVTLCVEDYGIGIPTDKQEKVFEQFYRVSGTKEHTFPGLGLGLYISAEIIKRMGGRIWVTSAKDKGSTFCFAFPTKNID